MDVVKSRRIAMTHPGMSRLSQETPAILGVGVALAALLLTDTVGVRGEFQAVRAEIQAVRAEIQAVRAEARADREALRAEARADREALRAEARADREAMRAEHETFQEAMRAEHETFRNHILRLTEQQGVLSARLDGLRDPPTTNR